MLSEFGPLWGTKSVQRLRDPHASVTFPSEDARIRVDPPERLTPGRLVATTACSGRHETPGTGPTPAAGTAYCTTISAREPMPRITPAPMKATSIRSSVECGVEVQTWRSKTPIRRVPSMNIAIP